MPLTNFNNYSRFCFSNRTRWNSSSKNISELNISFLISCFWFMQKNKNNMRVRECAIHPDTAKPTQTASPFTSQKDKGQPSFGDFIFLAPFLVVLLLWVQWQSGKPAFRLHLLQPYLILFWLVGSHLLIGKFICSFTWDCFTISIGCVATRSLFPPRKMLFFHWNMEKYIKPGN